MAISDISHRKRFLAEGNVYLPHIAVIEKIVDETPGIRTFHFNFKDEKLRRSFLENLSAHREIIEAWESR